MKHTTKFLVLLLAAALLVTTFATPAQASSANNNLTARAAGGITNFKVNKDASVTLKVEVEADDMSGITYSWKLQSYFDSSTHKWTTVNETLDNTTDTYVVSAASRSENYLVYIEDGLGNYTNVSFSIQIQNNFQLYAQVDVNDFIVLNGDSAELEVKAYGKDLDQVIYKWYRVPEHDHQLCHRHYVQRPGQNHRSRLLLHRDRQIRQHLPLRRQPR